MHVYKSLVQEGYTVTPALDEIKIAELPNTANTISRPLYNFLLYELIVPPACYTLLADGGANRYYELMKARSVENIDVFSHQSNEKCS